MPQDQSSKMLQKTKSSEKLKEIVEMPVKKFKKQKKSITTEKLIFSPILKKKSVKNIILEEKSVKKMNKKDGKILK